MAVSGGIFGCQGVVVCYWHLVGRAYVCSGHPTMHGTDPGFQEEPSDSKASIMSRLRHLLDEGLGEEGSG